MKRLSNILTISFSVVVILLGNVANAQQATKPDHRFAIRWNTLGLIKLDGIGEFEYSISRRLGVYVGLGIDSPTFGMVNYSHRRTIAELPCKQSIWGAYVGARISTPIGKLVGLSLKPAVYFQRVKMSGPGCMPSLHTPQILNYQVQIIGGLVGVAYAQTFLQRCFVEPVIGFGYNWVTNNGEPQSKFYSSGIGIPLQLNLGIRF